MGECCPRWNALLYRALFTLPSFKRNASVFFLKRLYDVSRTGASPSWFLPNVCLVLAVLPPPFFSPFDTCESVPQPLLAPWILFICLFIYLFFCSFFPDMTLAHFFLVLSMERERLAVKASTCFYIWCIIQYDEKRWGGGHWHWVPNFCVPHWASGFSVLRFLSIWNLFFQVAAHCVLFLQSNYGRLSAGQVNDRTEKHVEIFGSRSCTLAWFGVPPRKIFPFISDMS